MNVLRRIPRVGMAAALIVLIAAAGFVVARRVDEASRTNVVAYFDNSNGIFSGDDVRIRGVNVGKIVKIEPEPTRVKITFWVDGDIKVPANADAVILSPTLVTARAVQLTPPYRDGPVLANNTVIPQNRTAVPMEWDDFRKQLERLTATLQPTEPGGVSTLGGFVNTVADNLRGQGPAIHDAIVKLSQTISALGDHSEDIFGSVKSLSLLVAALQDSTSLIRDLNGNLAAVTGLFAQPDELSNAVKDLNAVAGEVNTFVADNREALGTTSDKLASITTALTASTGDIKQVLHVLPNVLQNANSLYQPAQGTLSGILAANNFANPINFLCGAIQASSRMGSDQSAKLCVQYLAPIIKNRQYTFPPLGMNPIVGAAARPNEVTYSEDWMRPDYVPPQPVPAAGAPAQAEPPGGGTAAPPEDQPGPLAAEAPMPPPAQPTDPSAGLAGMMAPPGAGR